MIEIFTNPSKNDFYNSKIFTKQIQKFIDLQIEMFKIRKIKRLKDSKIQKLNIPKKTKGIQNHTLKLQIQNKNSNGNTNTINNE